MSEWEPAMDAEVAMRDALRTDDQESYFRILAGVDLLLPVSADALAGLAPLGWGTWSTGGRTHVLAFTSPSALQACLADYTGSARRVAYSELADTWPNLEWWLAVNPGLPIEGYLPAWFVAQLSRGDLRLPTRGPAREGGQGKKIQDLQAAALAANAAATGPRPESPAYPQTAADPGGFARRPAASEPVPGGGYDQRQPAGQPAPGGYAQQTAASEFAAGGYAQPAAPSVPAAGGYAQRTGPGEVGYAQPAAPDVPAPGGYPQQTPAGEPISGGYPRQSPASEPMSGGYPQRAAGAPAGGGFGQAPGRGEPTPAASGGPDQGPPPGGYGFAQGPGPGQLGPGGLPIRTPGAVLPSGLPSRVPAGSQPPSSSPGAGSGGPSAYPPPPGAPGGGQAAPSAYPPPGTPGDRPVVPSAYSQPGIPGSGPAARPGAFGSPPPTGAPSAFAGNEAAQGGPGGSLRVPGAAAAFGSRGGAGGAGASDSGGFGAAPGGQPGGRSDLPPLPDRGAALPTRTPLAQTPPLPPHLTPEQARRVEAAESQPQALAQPAAAPPPVPGALGGALPRRQVTPPSERPPSMAAAAQALAGTRTPTAEPPTSQPPTSQPSSFPSQAAQSQAPAGAEATRFGPAPPVIPGAGGSDRPAAGSGPPPFVPAASFRPTIPAEQAEPPRSPAPSVPGADDFVPANAVEQDLYNAAGGGSTDGFLSTLLLATVLVPVAGNSRPGSSPGEAGFAFQTEDLEGERFLVVFTSHERLGEHFAEATRTVSVRFVELIRNWPDPAWSFAVNPNTPVGAKYPGPQVIALASWAAESGLGVDPAAGPAVVESSAVPAPERATDSAQHATVMQKTVPAGQIDYFLDRGYDRVAGFVHRASEVEHLRTPGELFGALGLSYDGSPYQADAKEAFVLRWPAYRPSLYRIPYGGQSEQALRAMDGWVIERPPFRGNGFAPGEGRDVVAEFKVDSVRLPHGAQLWRMDADGDEKMIAVFDCDAPVWRRVGES